MTEQDDLIPVGIDEGLHVYLLPRLKWRHVSAIKWEILVEKEKAGIDLPAGEIIGLLQEGYITYGVARWDLTHEVWDEKKKATVVAIKPLTRESVATEILGNVERASIIAEKADELYSEQVLLPLVRMGAKSSPPTSTNGSTSATTGSSGKHPKPSKRSSITTTPTAAIEMTSAPPAGDSSS
jgi:hypothetical protein